MTAIDAPGASSSARPRLGLEVVIVLAISLGQSGVYSVLRIIERMTRGVELNQQTSTLNASVTPDRPWLDLTYQLVGVAFAVVPALLALYLLDLTDKPATRRIGFDLARPGFDAWFGTVIADSAQGWELTVVSAVVVGGVAITGGVGSVYGAALGALLLTTIGGALVVLRVNPFWQQAVTGALLLLAISVDRALALRVARLLRKRNVRHGP